MELVKGSEYKFEKVDALSQYHIVRRLAPLFGDAIAIIGNSGLVKNGQKASEIDFEKINFDELAKDITPLMNTLSKLPDEEMNYALFGLLKGVYRKNQGGGYSRITTDTNLFMFEDIKFDMALMMTLAGKSFMANLAGFLNALPSGLKEGALQSKPIG
jgi:hypothetical protein